MEYILAFLISILIINTVFLELHTIILFFLNKNIQYCIEYAGIIDRRLIIACLICKVRSSGWSAINRTLKVSFVTSYQILLFPETSFYYFYTWHIIISRYWLSLSITKQQSSSVSWEIAPSSLLYSSNISVC